MCIIYNKNREPNQLWNNNSKTHDRNRPMDNNKR